MPDDLFPWPFVALNLPRQSIDALQGVAIVVALSIVAGYIGYVLYRRSVGDRSGDATGEPLTLADLRQMHREGRLTDEEYEQAKARMVAMFRAEARKKELAEEEQEEFEDLGHLDDDSPAFDGGGEKAIKPGAEVDDAGDQHRLGDSVLEAPSENAGGEESPDIDDYRDDRAGGKGSASDGGDDGDEGPR